MVTLAKKFITRRARVSFPFLFKDVGGTLSSHIRDEIISCRYFYLHSHSFSYVSQIYKR